MQDSVGPAALNSFPPSGLAVVIGATGGVGAAVTAELKSSGAFAEVIGLSRRGAPALDLTDEATMAAAAAGVAARGIPLRLAFVATGFLHDETTRPEKSWRDLDPARLARAFALNAIGPALVMKHFLPLLAPSGKSVFAALSARVGSIGDNGLGGWHGYRASKAALNQFIRANAIELRRRWPDAVCVALHPGTVATRLSAPFGKSGLDVQTPEIAARRLLGVIDALDASQSGGFFDHRGETIPW
jgi:NAD(P)-dependent dehydrogenase (short-subunit alcohol dehydrogenase family)